MKHSIRLKITILLTCCIAGTIFLCWLINNAFLEEYYAYSKTKSLATSYNEIVQILENLDEDENLSDEDYIKIERISSSRNVNVYILRIYFVGLAEYIYPYPIDDIQKSQIDQRLDKINIFNKSSEYKIARYYDRRLDSEYIELISSLQNHYVVFLRSNYESIQDNVALANEFLAYMGIFSTIVGTFIMLIISKRFTNPILQLSEIAKRMSVLDFDVKYTGESNDEIGVLGSSINRLSGELQRTISELKSANNELQHDIENKIQIDEMRKEFLSNVSHELKTPIALIQGYAEGLKENINEDQESRDFYCDVIIDEANKMNNMVKKLLSLNQIEFGNNQIQFERFDIVALIRSVLASTDILMKQKDIHLIFEQEGPIYVWADEYMIEEVVTNYISNAIHHVADANIIEVKLIQFKDVVRVAVFNTGANIPEEDIDKIWIKFYKVDKARTREYGGSGIGLSIVKAIMDSLNRDCGVVNRKTGVEFWFELDITNTNKM